MEPGYALLACMNNFGMSDLPEDIEVKYVDSLGFFNLHKEGVPEELTSFPALTIKKDDKYLLYVNYHELGNNEYFVIETMLSQLIKIMFEKDLDVKDLARKSKNNFLQKNVEHGLNIYIEYKELSLLMSTMKTLYNSKEYTFQKKNPYVSKQSRKIALNMLQRTLREKQGNEKISSILYCMAKLQDLYPYNYDNIIEDKTLSSNLKMLNELLVLKFDEISKQTLNKIGTLGKVLSVKI